MKKNKFLFIEIGFVLILFTINKFFRIDNYTSFLNSVIIFYGYGFVLSIISSSIIIRFENSSSKNENLVKTLNFINFIEKITIHENLWQQLRINKSAILYDNGKYKEGLESLSFKVSKWLPSRTKIIYYNNVSSFQIKLGKLKDSESSLMNAENIYNKIKNTRKCTEELDIAILTCKAELKIEKKENDKQLNELLKGMLSLQPKHLRTNILINLLIAKIYYLKKEYDTAEKYISFVKNNSDNELELNEIKMLESDNKMRKKHKS